MTKMTEEAILDEMYTALDSSHPYLETLEDFLNMMTDEAVVILHAAIHKHFGD